MAVNRLTAYDIINLIKDRMHQFYQSEFKINDCITRTYIKNEIKRILDNHIEARNIYDYRIICDETNNTSEMIDRDDLLIAINIQETRLIQFKYIEMSVANMYRILGLNETISIKNKRLFSEYNE